MNGKSKLKKGATQNEVERIDFSQLKKKELLEMFPELDPVMTKKEILKYLEKNV